jgi:hypothetical protein
MNPVQTWKSNKWRSDLRKFTQDFIKEHFSESSSGNELGKLYAINYRTDSSIPTDKHHVSSIVLSFGKFKDDEGHVYMRSINLLYLKDFQILEILQAAWKNLKLKPAQRIAPTISLHEEIMKIHPFCFKNFQDNRIITIHEVESEQWGMIPLLKRHLLGNFNAEALNEDFQAENRVKRTLPKKKKIKSSRDVNEVLSEEKEEIISDDLTKIDFQDEDI